MSLNNGLTPQNADKQYKNLSAARNLVAQQNLSAQDAIFNTLFVQSTSNLGEMGVTGNLSITDDVTAGGTIQGSVITDGTASLSSGVLSGASINIPANGSLSAVSGFSTSIVGTASLTSGSVTVANTAVNANTLIFLTRQTAATVGTSGGSLYYSKNNGVSFTILSTNPSDNGQISWLQIGNA